MKVEMSVMLNVKSVERSIAFYHSLGFTSRWRWGEDGGKPLYAGVGLGEAVIALGQIRRDADGGRYDDYSKWVSTPLGAGVMVSIELNGVDRIYEKAKRARVKIESRIREWPYGRAFTVNDPDGYVVRFLKPKGEFA